MKKKIQKPFDAELAKKGAKVETRDGNSVRILCYDRIKTDYPIVALINFDNEEACISYNIKGSLNCNQTNKDLVIIEEIECPKFQVGAFIVFNGNVYEILYVDNTNNLYHFQSVKYGFSQKLPIKNIDNICNHWNTNDARPGDVLIDYHNKPFIFKGYTDKEHPGCPVAYCGINNFDVFTISSINYYWSNEHVRPATYEERQQLFNRLEAEGYKWNAESLTLTKIQKRWRGDDDENAIVSGYFIDRDSRIVQYSGYDIPSDHNIFATEKQAKSALAMAQISQIMANDERFGGVITDEEWNINKKYIIIRRGNNLGIETRYCYEYLAFHTNEQAELFLKENEDLIKDYYMLN